jgi:hypothetical protein
MTDDNAIWIEDAIKRNKNGRIINNANCDRFKCWLYLVILLYSKINLN